MGKEDRRSRTYVFTVNNYSDDDIETLKDIEYKYIIIGKEVGKKGTPHLQGYITFDNKKSWKQLTEIMPKQAWFEQARGDSKSNYDYCGKDNLFFEDGDRPISKKEQGELEKARWKRAREAAISGDLSTVDDDIYIRHIKNLEHIAKKHKPKPQNLDKCNCEWIYGPPGTGKSHKARAENPDLYLKMPNKWWDDYNDEEAVLIDDFEHTMLRGMLKIWADRYIFRCETKGGTIVIRPKKLIITSNYSIADLFGNEDPMLVEALEGRFTQILMDGERHAR